MKRLRPSTRAFQVLLLTLSAASGAAPAAAQGVDRLDDARPRPVSPGSLALLVGQPSMPAALISAAIGDSRPEVRAAVARVIFVTGARALVPDLIEALRVESSADAAVEQARAIAHFGASDGVILDAWERLDSTSSGLLEVVASARGPAALRDLPRVRAAAGHERVLSDFIRVATRADRAELTRVAGDAIRTGDARLLAASTDAARRESVDLGEDVIELALAPARPVEIRLEGLRHLLRTWDGDESLPRRVRAAIGATIDAGLAPPTDAAMLTIEMAGRAAGRRAGAATGWQALLSKPTPELRDELRLASVRTLMTDRERETFGQALFTDDEVLARPTAAERRLRASTRGPTIPIRTAPGYPPGFMRDVFAVAACDLEEAGNALPAAGAMITLRADGRPERVSLMGAQVPAGCMAAFRALMMTFVIDSGEIVRPGQEAQLVLPSTNRCRRLRPGSTVSDILVSGLLR